MICRHLFNMLYIGVAPSNPISGCSRLQNACKIGGRGRRVAAGGRATERSDNAWATAEEDAEPHAARSPLDRHFRVGGRQVWESFATKEAAELYLARTKIARIRGEFRETEKVLFEVYAPEWLEYLH